MQVYMIRNTETDIHLFSNFSDIEPSIRMSYFKLQDVVITPRREAGSDRVIYNVKFTRNGKPGEDDIIVEHYAVWDAPCHI